MGYRCASVGSYASRAARRAAGGREWRTATALAARVRNRDNEEEFRFYCDASALGKRYAPEVGTPLVNHLFAGVPHSRLVMLTQGLGETLSILVRRRNALLTAA